MASVIRRRIRRKFAATLAELQTPGVLLPSQWALAEAEGALVMRKSDPFNYDLVTILSSQSFNSQTPGASGASQVGVSAIDSDLPASDLQTTLETFKTYVDSLPETVQDKLGAFFTDSPTIDMVYNDAGNNAHLDIIPQGVRDALNSYFSNDPFPQYSGNSGAFIQNSVSEQNPANFNVSGTGRTGGNFTVQGGSLILSNGSLNRILNQTVANTVIENTNAATSIISKISGVNKLTVTNTYNQFATPVGIFCNPIGSGTVGTDSNPGITLSGKLAIAHDKTSQNNAIEIGVESSNTGNGIYIHGGQAFQPGNGYFYLAVEHTYGTIDGRGRFCIRQTNTSDPSINMGIGTFDTRGGVALNGETFDGLLCVAHRSFTSKSAIHIVADGGVGEQSGLNPNTVSGKGVFVQGGTSSPSTGLLNYHYFEAEGQQNTYTKFVVMQKYDPTPANQRMMVGIGTSTPGQSLDIKGGSARIEADQKYYLGSNGYLTLDSVTAPNPGETYLTVRNGNSNGHIYLTPDLFGSTLIANLAFCKTPRVCGVNRMDGSADGYINSRSAFFEGVVILASGSYNASTAGTAHLFAPTDPGGSIVPNAHGSVCVIINNRSNAQFVKSNGLTAEVINPNKAAIFIKWNNGSGPNWWRVS